MQHEQVAPARRTPALTSNPRRPAERESPLLDRYPCIHQRQGLPKEIPGVQTIARFRSPAAKAKAERVCREEIGSPTPSCRVLKAEMGNVCNTRRPHLLHGWLRAPLGEEAGNESTRGLTQALGWVMASPVCTLVSRVAVQAHRDRLLATALTHRDGPRAWKCVL